MPFLALKYSGISLFHFSFGFGDVPRVVSIVVASLAIISADFSLCCPFSELPVESPVVAGSWLPVEAVFCLPIETNFPDFACMAGGVFFFNFAMVSSSLVFSTFVSLLPHALFWLSSHLV